MWKSFVSELRGEWFEFVCDLLCSDLYPDRVGY
jgi:hypothetical protein